MARVVDLEIKTRQTALAQFVASVRQRFETRFPGISYDLPQFDFRQSADAADKKGKRLALKDLHKTNIQLAKPNLVEDALNGLHESFARAARAIIADHVLKTGVMDTQKLENGLRSFAYLRLFSDHVTNHDEWLAKIGTFEISELNALHLRFIERCVLTACMSASTRKRFNDDGVDVENLVVPGVEMRGLSGHNNRTCLIQLYRAIATLKQAKIVAPVGARIDGDISNLLLTIEKWQKAEFRDKKSSELEPGIAALSDALSAMADGDPRLSKIQEAALCVMGLEMCAPSRINEPLAMSIHDRLHSAEAFEHEPLRQDDESAELGTFAEAKLLHLVHASIREASIDVGTDGLPNTVLMKGSKGASWGAKPILDFMVVMFNECFDRLIAMGVRSRLLVKHYEECPGELFLPPGLEHYRGRPLTVIQIGRIMALDSDFGIDFESYKKKAEAARDTSQLVVRKLKNSGLMFTIDQRPDLAQLVVNDRQFLASPVDGLSATEKSHKRHVPPADRKLLKTDSRSEYAEWSSVEAELLRRINEAMDSIRWVTARTRYEGRLSNMLVLFDHAARTPEYLPGAMSSKDVATRLKSNSRGDSQKPVQTVFEALDIQMPIAKKGGASISIVPAYCTTHDPRRWLTTMALRYAGPQLSHRLINLWARRADVAHLGAYDYGTREEKAAAAAQALPEPLRNLPFERGDMSKALNGELIEDYGLKTQFISVGSHAIHVTTMEEIHAAESNHPVARAGGKVILLYPTPYGACLHQHHESGCTNYRGCESACADQRVVKGHLPTNERVREQARKLHDVIVAQVRRLTLAVNRKVVHDLDVLTGHIVAMVQQHMNCEEIADRLISEFNEIKDLIKDVNFKTTLEDAYAFKGKVERLDDPQVPAGALIRYCNPARHARPEAERSLEALGGRQAIESDIKSFVRDRAWARVGAPVGQSAELLAEGDAEIDQDE